ncbi:tRNA uridine-5-carboxymethylaminomethyl(34) synthesis GTPase MnmE [Isachenkonia alkalipeptolytica]|uniref:tRNA modification GTPase MnmE n=1 Tax=Isachenkonia alkalipeptolytica TaxID=2565777 RepID=A0AA43XML1_9CLOT|nr:tRNA uridine-5-carboxymethylaminomethyl(34) synthesis GTPase MnmE [Isachenkonia alkalipeptolytica]NBG89221.1 tRNA uridine-5-carboxymethylaminomethyl(34) synthesis GTPase MnmE [Isachenkonia alkalipeptolytica]
MYREETIAAISTPLGEGGIGIIKISGDKSLEILKSIFVTKGHKRKEDWEPRKMVYGYILHPQTQEMIDEVLAVYMKAPNTYTKEDLVEIHCHGGMVPLRKILALVLEQGAAMAEKGEFTKRAFLNGRLDLSQAEAVMDLISAKTDVSHDVALGQFEGILSQEVQGIQEIIKDMLAHIEVSIDFSEEDIDEVTMEHLLEKSIKAKESFETLLQSAKTGKILREGLVTGIVGKTNVGKSSLLNALLRENRAIVTDIPGTTRDVIEEQLNVRGIPLKILDTAGIRDTEDAVEKIGVQRSREIFQQSDLVIFMIDASKKLDREDYDFLEIIKDRRALVIINKTDLEEAIDLERIKSIVGDKKLIRISLLKNKGLEALEDALEEMAYEGDGFSKEQPFITNARHQQAISQGLMSLEEGIKALENRMPLDFVEVDLKNAWESLGEVTGDTVSEDILDHIFENFCIGK